MNMCNEDKIISYIEPTQPIIGKLIREELQRQNRTVSWLSRKLNCDRRNIYNIFKRPSIDTGLLLRISHVLNTDFFANYSRSLKALHPPTPENHRGIVKKSPA